MPKIMLKEIFPAFKENIAGIFSSQKMVDEQPLRAELFSIDQFEQHAKFLAEKHSVSFQKGKEKLLSRLKQNEEILLKTYELLNEAGKAKRRISPAGEWLLDNFYLIEEQIRLSQKHLPKGYSRQLPHLSKGPFAGYPRVYDIAMEIVSHGDGRVDLRGLSSFVSAYQKVKTLKLGELWAIPIMIRLALIENLRRVASRLILSQTDRDKADYWASKILEVSAKDANGVIIEIASMAKMDLPMSSSFVAEFARRLQGQSSALNLPITWLEKKLSEKGETINRLIQSASQKQASDQVSISNTIGSLRFLEVTNWKDFVESQSAVEKILLNDPAKDYSNMTFATRDIYRHVVEKAALRSRLQEEDVAQKAVNMADESKEKFGKDDARAHVGYYLIDKGLQQFYKGLDLRLPFDEYLQAKKTFLPLFSYIGTVALITFAVTAVTLCHVWNSGIKSWPWLLVFGFSLFFISSQLAVSLVNWLATILVKPQKIPRMDYSEGIPAHAHTLVAVPTMLTNKASVENLIESLEVRYLANNDANLNFALLTDFPDAKEETMPGDELLIRAASEGIERLNHKYRRHKENIFCLFHRPRTWNPKEKLWMGYERKRGKLSDLNSLLRGKGRDKFSVLIGDIDSLQDVKYVITLDTDTHMPRDAARELVGTIAHPLNAPFYDEQKQKVTRGYGILQPRVESGYPGDNPSLFVKVYGGESGIDPYTRAVSDVYQDLFFEGSFIGKGLYDVDAFERSLEGRFPENLILSHDLLEGCYARSALITDVQLYEDYPSGYIKDASRRHRWIRGDWQILKWLFTSVPGLNGKKYKNPLSILSKWKILDNLRRSLVPIATALLLIFGWAVFDPSWFFSLIILGFIGLPILLISLTDIMRKPADISINSHIDSVWFSFNKHLIQFCFSISFAAYEAFFSFDAILTTLCRMFISKRRLLEWRTSSESEKSSPGKFYEFYKRMFVSPLISLTSLIYFTVQNIRIDGIGMLIIFLWFFAPAAAYLIGLPSLVKKTRLSVEESLFLRKLSRKIWAFFETFVTEKDNWLPPDNFQEEPPRGIAHRTSPTNIGLYLLSNLSAYDFGYVSMGKMFNKTEKALSTMNRMDRYRRHFYNWYDTETLKPLEPLYVSTVDSGNLAGHLLVLRSGLAGMLNHKIVSAKIFNGLLDTLNILDENLKDAVKNKTKNISSAVENTVERIVYFREKLASPPAYLSEINALLRQFLTDISKMTAVMDQKYFENVKKWAQSFEKQCYDYLADISYIAPWILLAPQLPGMFERGNEEQQKRLSSLNAELRKLDEIPTLREVARIELKLYPLIDSIVKNMDSSDPEVIKEKEWLHQLKNIVKVASTRASERISAIDYIALRCSELSNIEYDFLYNKASQLLSIGFNVNEHKADSACYDLLASEARLCSFVAIAQGRLPQEHWFALGRMLSKSGGDPVLVSWGGSMFEYLMPLLVMPNFEGTLLDRTYKAVIKHQIEYAAENNVPWGISESGYNTVDANMVYQYHSFGVPDIGFKRGLSEDLVVAPYATVMALMVDTEKACDELRLLAAKGFEGNYGFYEAIDYTPSRLAHDEQFAVVKSYMAHHQGMSMLSLAYILLDRPMQNRFLTDPMFKATELLLQERVPKSVPFLYDTEVTGLLNKLEEKEALMRVFTNPNTPGPEIHLLSNGRYNVMVTNAGGGYSKWGNLAVTRWKEDPVTDCDGSFVYLRDIKTGEYWSASFQPTLKKPKNYEAIFSQSRAEFKRKDNNIDLHCEIAVSPEDDIELRRIKITNRSRSKRVIELTSYAEVVLNNPSEDIAHRCFSNLFVETEIIKSHQAIIASRRPRSESEKFPLLLHLMAVHGNSIVGATYETDRGKFIGRGNNLSNPYVMKHQGLLSDSEGPVLDPIVSIRCRVELQSEESATIDYVTGICADKEAGMRLMEKYRDKNLADRVFDLAWTHGQVALQQINATEAEAQIYGRLASAIVYTNPAWRANESILRQNFRGQSDLWGYSISGDLPIVIVRIEDQANIDLIVRMVQAHTYWRMKGLIVDLVIWNEDSSVYRDMLGERINGFVFANAENKQNQPGGIFVRRSDQMSEEDKILMLAVARIVITDRSGTLAEQLDHIAKPKSGVPQLAASKKAETEEHGHLVTKRPDLVFYNGAGGFTQDGKEYVIATSDTKVTPAPWVNVIANKNFGTVISESGSAYTWSENAHEFRLTPWKNDQVTDIGGEALYIRDEETGEFWSTCPFPAKGKTHYVSRHGFGYSVFEHTENGILSELTVFVAKDSPVKFFSLKAKNLSREKRFLSATAYFELIMGTIREKSQLHIYTEIDPKSGALIAHNPYNKEFPNRVFFLDSSETSRFVSGDRREFIGRNGTMTSPEAMKKEELSGKVGAGMDPCAAMQVKFELDEGYEKEIIFTMGSGKNIEEARMLLARFGGETAARQELENIWDLWKHILGVVYVETPDKTIDFLVNGWLQYQIISCRLWARSGYYQSGGAFGFRDQLQDVMSLTHSKPEMIREHILFFASRQFVEGDVQHWWHEPSGRGVRSRCSDDYLWLAYVTSLYVNEIGDTGVLDEKVHFLEGPLLKPEEESYYDLPRISSKTGTLYEHCVLAIERSLKYSVHGLPLIGGGDWNDGMNLVGIKGSGESVWLAFFQYDILKSFSKIAKNRGDSVFAEKCIAEAEKLKRNADANGWDGKWYKRAYFDDGQALGSETNAECRIDSIPQSWSIISGAADAEKTKTALQSVDKMLVDRKNSLIKLLTPAFDKTELNPGYIKGYLPGVRENGGQYSHAAVWVIMASAIMKNKSLAWELFSLINPIKHGSTAEKSLIYKVEPYVMPGDVYAVKPNEGRGGWTWYTGSASWMYQLITKYLLGLRLKVDKLYFEPCLPENWKKFKLHYRYRETFYHINFVRAGSADNVVSVILDGSKREEKNLPLVDDRIEHEVEVKLG